MGEIAKLLTHFYIPGIDQQIERAMAHDWATDLSEFDHTSVRDACTQWRRTQKRRPTIAEMIELCAKYKRQAEREAKWNASTALTYQRDRYTDIVPREQMAAWNQAWRENWPAPEDMTAEEWKQRIRKRAKEICPECSCEMPGEGYT